MSRLDYEMQIEEVLEDALNDLDSKAFESLLERVKETIENFS